MPRLVNPQGVTVDVADEDAGYLRDAGYRDEGAEDRRGDAGEVANQIYGESAGAKAAGVSSAFGRGVTGGLLQTNKMFTSAEQGEKYNPGLATTAELAGVAATAVLPTGGAGVANRGLRTVAKVLTAPSSAAGALTKGLKAGQVATTAVRLGTEGALYGAGNWTGSAIAGDPRDVEELVHDVGLGGLVGGGLGAIGGIFGARAAARVAKADEIVDTTTAGLRSTKTATRAERAAEKVDEARQAAKSGFTTVERTRDKATRASMDAYEEATRRAAGEVGPEFQRAVQDVDDGLNVFQTKMAAEQASLTDEFNRIDNEIGALNEQRILYEAHTNSRWGGREAPATADELAYEAARVQYLKSEGKVFEAADQVRGRTKLEAIDDAMPGMKRQSPTTTVRGKERANKAYIDAHAKFAKERIAKAVEKAAAEGDTEGVAMLRAAEKRLKDLPPLKKAGGGGWVLESGQARLKGIEDLHSQLDNIGIKANDPNFDPNRTGGGAAWKRPKKAYDAYDYQPIEPRHAQDEYVRGIEARQAQLELEAAEINRLLQLQSKIPTNRRGLADAFDVPESVGAYRDFVPQHNVVAKSAAENMKAHMGEFASARMKLDNADPLQAFIDSATAVRSLDNIPNAAKVRAGAAKRGMVDTNIAEEAKVAKERARLEKKLEELSKREGKLTGAKAEALKGQKAELEKALQATMPGTNGGGILSRFMRSRLGFLGAVGAHGPITGPLAWMAMSSMFGGGKLLTKAQVIKHERLIARLYSGAGKAANTTGMLLPRMGVAMDSDDTAPVDRNDRELFQELADDIAGFSNVSEDLGVAAGDEMREYSPENAEYLQATVVRGMTYLAKSMPKNPGTVGDEWSPSPTEMKQFFQRYQTVMEPNTAWEDLADGTITAVQIEALKAVYPETVNSFKYQLLQDPAALKKLPRNKKIMVSLLIDEPLDVSMRPQVVTGAQARLNAASGVGPSAPGPGGGQGPSRGQDPMANQMATQGDRVTAR